MDSLHILCQFIRVCIGDIFNIMAQLRTVVRIKIWVDFVSNEKVHEWTTIRQDVIYYLGKVDLEEWGWSGLPRLSASD